MRNIRNTLSSVICTKATFLVTATIILSVALSLIAAKHPVNAFGLKVSPLKYEAQLELGDKKLGYIDVSNPSDFSVTVTPEVEAFRQIDTDGNLEFYEDEQLKKGITLNQNRFDLGPREAARIFFTINSNNLPEGGVYGALLFGINSQDEQSGDRPSIATTTRVGTLLLLENGDNGVKNGKISRFDIPFWQFGDGINGSVAFRAQESERALAFAPELQTVLPLAGETGMESGLVFPGNTRDFTINRHGSYIGVFPVEVKDEITGSTQRSWVLAVTGIWRIIISVAGIGIAVVVAVRRRNNHTKRKRLNRKRKPRHRYVRNRKKHKNKKRKMSKPKNNK